MSATDLHWDPFDHHLHVDPYGVWRRLRDEQPVYHNPGLDFYALSRFQDVLEASMDTRRFSSAHGIVLDMIQADPLPDPKPMIMMDPPEHTSFRKMINRTFTPRRMSALDDRITELCAMYLDPFVGADHMDLVRDFSMKLPVMVISSLLGFPEEDHDNLRIWSDAQLHRDEDNTALSAEGEELGLQLFAYYADQVQKRRKDPGDDIVSELLAADFVDYDGTTRRLDDGEMVMFIALINIAGNETVARLLGWAGLILDQFHDERTKLVDNPDLIPGAVEELLRFEAPSPVQGRFTTEAVELHDRLIPAGSKVLLLTGSAGRDEREFDDPDLFDVERTVERHLSFGHAAHFCLGAALARTEGRIGLRELLRRFPAWTVDHDRIEFVHTNSVRGPASLPVAL